MPDVVEHEHRREEHEDRVGSTHVVLAERRHARLDLAHEVEAGISDSTRAEGRQTVCARRTKAPGDFLQRREKVPLATLDLGALANLDVAVSGRQQDARIRSHVGVPGDPLAALDALQQKRVLLGAREFQIGRDRGLEIRSQDLPDRNQVALGREFLKRLEVGFRHGQPRCPASFTVRSSTAWRMTSRGASVPVQSRNCSAACSMNISMPLITVLPWAAACLSRAVSTGL